MAAHDEILAAIIRGGANFVAPPDKWEWSVVYQTDQDDFNAAYIVGLRKLDSDHIVNDIFDKIRDRGFTYATWRRYKDNRSYKVKFELWHSNGEPRTYRSK